MKQKMVKLALGIVAGVSVLGMTAFAEVSVQSECLHQEYWVNIMSEIYEPANSVYHWVEVTERHWCNNCSYFEDSYYMNYEEHSFDVYANGTRYCSECGYEDEFYL